METRGETTRTGRPDFPAPPSSRFPREFTENQLKPYLQAKLSIERLPRPNSGCAIVVPDCIVKLAQARSVSDVQWWSEVDVIEDIEQLGTELNLDELVDSTGLEDRKIDGLIARAEHLVSARGASERAGGT